jgi:hypothetical protein
MARRTRVTAGLAQFKSKAGPHLTLWVIQNHDCASVHHHWSSIFSDLDPVRQPGTGNDVKQSRTISLVEATTNVVVGYVLAIATQIVVFPLFGIEAALGDHLAIGLAFVGVSLIRGYLLRRLFEALQAR